MSLSEDEAKNVELSVSDYEIRDADWIEVKEDFINNGHNLKVKVERDEMVEEDIQKMDPLFVTENEDVSATKVPWPGPKTHAEYPQAGEELLELVDRWGVEKWETGKASDDLWEAPSVQNVRKAVRMKFLTKDCGADLLGLDNKEKFDTDEEKDGTEIPVFIQNIIDMWGIVTREEFTKAGKTHNKFFMESFVKKVFYMVQTRFLTNKGGAKLLGVSMSTLTVRRQSIYGKNLASQSPLQNLTDLQLLPELDKSLHMKAEMNDNWKKGDEVPDNDMNDIWMKADAVADFEIIENWWENMESGSVNTEQLYLERTQVTKTWVVFLLFSQLEIYNKKARFNPYTAGKQEVADFFQLVKSKQGTKRWTTAACPDETCLASVALFLPDLFLPSSVVELMTSHPPSLNVGDVTWSMVMSPASPYNSTWENFCQFCEQSGGDWDPFDATPALVRSFLVSKFEGTDMRLGDIKPKRKSRHDDMRLAEIKTKRKSRPVSVLEKEPFFRPAHIFYRDNLDRILTELDWHLKHSWLNGPLKESKEMELLNKAAFCCDERLVTDDPELKVLVYKLSPNYSYSKVRRNYSEDLFWERKFTQNILADVKKGAVPVFVAASGLGVTPEMIIFAIKENSSVWDKCDDQDNPTGVIAVKDYVALGYGSSILFWKEQSIVDLLVDVRNRKLSLDQIAAVTGVSRREISERCGGVKELAEIEAEKALAAVQKLKKKAEQQKIVVKKKSQLEIQIEMAEKNVGSLSDYEKMRLKNMIERQALLESLDFDKERREILALTPKNRPGQAKEFQLREKSARVKRRSQVEQLRKIKINLQCNKNEWDNLQNSKLSPKWFGHWVPRVHASKEKSKVRKVVSDVDLYDVYDEEAISISNHVPKFELRAQELLEISASYHKSRTLLDSFATDLEGATAEERLVAKSDWSNFDLIQDTMVSVDLLTSIDTFNDYICFGTKTGGVGVTLAGRAFTIRPHNMEVTRTLFLGNKKSPGILSASLDGTVRLTDLVKQSVCLEYCWDQSYAGKQGVSWLEQRGVHSFLLDCVGEINQIDIRSKDAFQLFEVDKNQATPEPGTNLSVNPANKNQMSLSRSNAVQIWDLRKTSEALVTLPGPSGTLMAGGGWSSGGSFFGTSMRGKSVVYNGTDFSQALEWKGSKKTIISPSTGVSWCPWEEPMFLTTMEQAKLGSVKQAVVAVDCMSGEVVGELISGLDISNIMVHCSKSREVVVMGNSKGLGGLAVFGVLEEIG